MRLRMRVVIVSAWCGLAVSCNGNCSGTPLPPPAPTVADITVSFAGTTSSDPALLLYSGREGPSCVTYDASIANPTVTLVEVTYDPDCPVEMTAFAPLLGAWAQDIDPAESGSSDWLLEAIETGVLNIEMPELTRLPVKVWIVASEAGDKSDAEKLRDRLLNKANAIFETSGAGFTLDTSVTTFVDPTVTSVAVRCSEAGSITSNPAIYDKTRINIYFIWAYENVYDTTPGYNCWQEGHPDIVFISWGHEDVVSPTLAHEIGHALGLIHPKDVGSHTFDVDGFTSGNLLWGSSEVTNVTVGQLYSLNFSAESWLNRDGSPLRRPIVKPCADSWSASPCVDLMVRVPGWP